MPAFFINKTGVIHPAVGSPGDKFAFDRKQLIARWLSQGGSRNIMFRLVVGFSQIDLDLANWSFQFVSQSIREIPGAFVRSPDS